MENKIPISEWKTGVDEKGGYWIEPNTNKKWRWKSNGDIQTAIWKINSNPNVNITE
jgi:hypothetical protein